MRRTDASSGPANLYSRIPARLCTERRQVFAWNVPASRSIEECLRSAVTSRRRKSCSSSLASFPISSKFRWEGRLRDILVLLSSLPLHAG